MADRRRSSFAASIRPAFALEAAALAVIVAVAGWIFAVPLHTATNYDEGNYLAALTDLRHGFVLGKDVYADQPPGWYALLRLLAWVFGNSLTGIRTGMLVIALVGVVAAWACARPLGPIPALTTAALLVIAAPYPAEATQVEADPAAAALALVALALAVWAYRVRGSAVLAAIAGVVLACAISIKLSAATALLPFALLVLFRRRLAVWSVAGAAVVGGVELFASRHELRAVARGTLGQHTSALGSSHYSRSANVHVLEHFLGWRTPFSWLVLAALLGTIWLAWLRSPATRLLGALWLFVPAAAAFILALKPLLDHHLVILAVSIALPAGSALGVAVARLPRTAGGGALALLAVLLAAAGGYQQHRQLVRNVQPEPSWILNAAAWMRTEAAPGEVVATDIPIIAYYAHRRLVPDLVDTSFTRFSVGDLTPAEVFTDLDRYQVRVAAIGRALFADTRIRAGFITRFRHRINAPNVALFFNRRSP